jgi:AcrR family transcriptional regulator
MVPCARSLQSRSSDAETARYGAELPLADISTALRRSDLRLVAVRALLASLAGGNDLAVSDRRRKPRQDRSRATRDAIVEAAARVFAELGLARATTARIAEVAGVGPGSMYQYFPSKDSLVVAIYEREALEQHAAFVQMAAELGTDDVAGLVRAFVEWTIRQFELKKDLNRVFLDELPRAGFDHQRAIDQLASQTVRGLLEIGGARVRPANRDAAALVVVRAFRYLLISFLTEPLRPEERDAFVDELVDLLSAYLLAPRTWRLGA